SGHGGKRIYLAEPETVEYASFLLEQGMIHFIDHHKHGLFTAAKHVGNRVVEVGDARGDIDHKKNDRSFLNGDQHLFADGRLKHVVRAVYIAPRIDNRKRVTRPFTLAVMPIARHATEIVYNRPSAFCQSVIQRRFTDIWPSYYCDDVCHKRTKVRIRNGNRVSLLSVAPKYRQGKHGRWPAEAP